MSNAGRTGIGLIGSGTISSQYLRNLTAFPDVEVHIVADLFVDKAAEQAAAFGVRESGPPEAALAHPDVDIIINLTIPAVHAEVSAAALESGKHVWTEKPLALDRGCGAGDGTRDNRGRRHRHSAHRADPVRGSRPRRRPLQP